MGHSSHRRRQRRNRASRFNRVWNLVRMLAPSPMPQWMIDELTKPLLATDETMYFDKGPTRKLAPFVSPLPRQDRVMPISSVSVSRSAADMLETIERHFELDGACRAAFERTVLGNIALSLYIGAVDKPGDSE